MKQGRTSGKALGMSNESYFSDLLKTKLIKEADLAAAVDAYMLDRSSGLFPLGDIHQVDLAAAVEASPYARYMLADPKIEEASKRAAVGTAILMDYPLNT